MENLNNLIQERAQYIDEQIQSFWVTKENAKEYHIDIVKSTTYDWDLWSTTYNWDLCCTSHMDEYKIYKLVWTFKA